MHKSEEGGSLYVSCSKGECVQDRICSFGSNTVNPGAYCYIEVSDEFPNKNYLLDSTITSSGQENPDENDNICLYSGEINMKSINISNSKLYYDSIYNVVYSSNSNVTLSTFSNNTTTFEDIYEIYVTALSDSLEFKILFCNFFENECNYFIISFHDLFINNCSFNKNNINERYFSTDSKQIIVKGCYFDISDPIKIGNVIITEELGSIYPENYHLSSGLCFAKLKLEFPEEKKAETEEKEEIKINFKRKNKFNIFVCFVFIFPK
ncbi:hypothetical protein TVAG_378220 [Trichomonas vaginalis G3]|uniref:Uncharacterized protein n=1 Tax=Trichomonas vaginalis (strain ATCC PRA-98 / G3) TaxID=412133 RepID=A2DB13_TRIV3|nr:hypothetical protein TVAGG3_0798500 [Trichomonas vaginalis G3]EAY22343.1 hypothetical protein TVAG_378220 [Trichomonas vaginalis G3]KAI5496331.1 hypothetical protein TVAGG3_0798500 [Trichomonas vaginalis G3]|eukprot:XP_001583329.1 hypothetical protein [Trichomonas vaginalis G3]